MFCPFFGSVSMTSLAMPCSIEIIAISFRLFQGPFLDYCAPPHSSSLLDFVLAQARVAHWRSQILVLGRVLAAGLLYVSNFVEDCYRFTFVSVNIANMSQDHALESNFA